MFVMGINSIATMMALEQGQKAKAECEKAYGEYEKTGTDALSDPIWDKFERISGSRTYPSDDPNDSPYDTFKCKLCGWSFKEVMYGSFNYVSDINPL